jgi:hypothetical protein
MLGLLLKQHEAGACSPKWGKQCGCTAGGRVKQYDCAGVCRVTGHACQG